MNDLLGTPFYVAPEIIGEGDYGLECDLWSMGVVMYILLTGRPPFYGSSNQGIFKKILKGVYPKKYL